MRNTAIKTLFPAFTLAVSLVWFFLGTTHYGIWNPIKGPERGFFPAIISVILFFASLSAIARSAKGKPPAFKKEESYVVLSAISIYLCAFLVGLLPTLFAYALLWLRFLEKYPWKTTLSVTLVLAAAVYGVFAVWLGVMFPCGLLFEAR